VSRRILLVDDDPAVLRGVGGLLRDEGYRTETATTAAEAHEALSRDPPAAVVLDLGLPARAASRSSRAFPGRCRRPWSCSPAAPRPARRRRRSSSGATDFVEKPPTAERLLTALQNALALRDLEEERERLREELAQREA